MEVEVEEVLVVEVVQWEQEDSSVELLLSMCSLVGLVDVAASEAVNALPVCVYAVHRDCYGRSLAPNITDLSFHFLLSYLISCLN